MENPDFLKKKYNLHNTPEVKTAAKRTAIRIGEKVPQKPAEQIQNYLDRFTEIIERKNPEKREQGIEALKKVLYNQCVIKPEEVPEAYFESQRRIAREQGHGDVEIGEAQKEQLTEVIIADQESSLDTWVDYLSSPDATYPDWLKYFAMRNVVGMGEFDKESKQFTKRSKGTTKPFPDLNREALAYVLDAVEKKQHGLEYVPDVAYDAEEEKKFEKLLQSENFPKLYAWAIEKVTPASQDVLTNTQGKWVKYDRKSDHMPLVESLQGHGTGWCTAGESTAKTQLEMGDFYVYYSLDQQGKPTIPRAAIRMHDGEIAEVRGIADQQNLDPYIGEVVQDKMKEFPDGAEYEKKARDMKTLTAIENKTTKGKELTPDDIRFLYEMDEDIEGFGYGRDPRIQELKSKRNFTEDIRGLYLASIPDSKERSGKTDSDFVEWLAGHGKMLPEIIPKLGDLTETSAFNLIEKGRVTVVSNHLGKFKNPEGNLSEELALKLIEKERGDVVGRSLDRFENPLSVVSAMNVSDQRDYVITNLGQYKTINKEELITALIASGGARGVSIEISSDKNIDGLSEDTLIKLLESGGFKEKDKELNFPVRQFEGLGERSASKLIEMNEVETLVRNLKYFHSLSKEILLKLLEKRDVIYDKGGNNPVDDERASAYGNAIIADLGSFRGLDNEVAQILSKTEIKETYMTSQYSGGKRYTPLISSVADNLEKFQGVDHTQLFNTLLADNDTETIIRNIDKFPEANQQQFVDSIINVEPFYGNRTLSDNLAKFQHIDREKLSESLLQKRVYWMVTENLDYFSHLKPLELADRLMKEESGFGAIAANLEKFEGLDHQALALEIVEKADPSGFGEFIKNIDKFGSIDYDTVFQKLLTRFTEIGMDKSFYFRQQIKDGAKGKLEKVLSPETKKQMREMRIL